MNAARAVKVWRARAGVRGEAAREKENAA